MRMPLRLTTCSRRKIEYSMTPGAAQRPGQPCYHDSAVTKGNLFLPAQPDRSIASAGSAPFRSPRTSFRRAPHMSGGLIDTDELAERVRKIGGTTLRSIGQIAGMQ